MPQSIKFTDRPLVQAAVSDVDFPRKAHLSGPGRLFRPDRTGIPILHPADHHTASVRCQDGLRGIKIDPVIDGLIIFLLKTEAGLIVMTDQAEGSVAAVILIALRQHVLWAYEKHLLPVQFKEIRAFPHFPETVPVLRQDRLIFP